MGVYDRRVRERELRRRAILEAAKEVFLEKGFESARMEDIAERCELGKGTLYFYFRSKEELYLALLQEGVNELFERIENKLEEEGEVEEVLRKVGEEFWNFYEDNKAFFRLFVFGRRRVSFIPEEVRRSNVNRGIRYLQRFSELLKKGIEKGSFREDDPWRLAVLCWALMVGALFLYDDEIHRGMIGLGSKELREAVLDFCLRGLKR